MFGQTTKLYWASLAERIRRFLAAVKQLTIAFVLSFMPVWTHPRLGRGRRLADSLGHSSRRRFVPRGTPTAYAKRSSFRTNS